MTNHDPEPMTVSWRQMFEILDREYQAALAQAGDRLANSVAHPEPPPLDARALLDHTRMLLPGGTLDALCAEFARHLKWHRMNSATAAKLFVRLQEARDLAQFVLMSSDREPFPAGAPVNFGDREQMIRWVLVDYWHHAGFWRSCYQSG